MSPRNRRVQAYPPGCRCRRWQCPDQARWRHRRRLDRAVLSALTRSFGGGPVGVSTLAVAVGEEATTVEEVCEPFLVRAGMLARTPRGRVATPQAWIHLDMTPPAGAGGWGQPVLFE